jgi:peptidyl-prolyl cis-trans isomerase B (cyclophilin B)
VRSSGSKREKEIARQKAERQAARRAEREAKQKKNAIIGAGIAVVIVALLIGLVAWSPWKGSGTVATPTPAVTTPAPSPTNTVQLAGCTTAPATRPDNKKFTSPPVLDTTKGTVLNLNTNCGLIAIQTDPVKAPTATRSMLGLAEAGYFDLTRCHRLTTSGIYVLQCGDPAGDGSGGPGYTIKDEASALPPKTGAGNYPAGSVAMAKASTPNSAGSQFFIVYKDTTLPRNYEIWGHVTEGLDRVTAIAGAGTDNANGAGDGHPNQPVVIVTATVSKK